MVKKNGSFNPRYVAHHQWGAERLYYLSHWLWKKKLRFCAYLIKYINMFIFRNFIPPEVQIGQRLDLPHGGFGVIIQENTIIGDDAIIFHNVTLANGNIEIGHRVYIGTGAIIIGPAKIGDDVAIGANTLVNYDVPSKSTVVGPKGRVLTTDM